MVDQLLIRASGPQLVMLWLNRLLSIIHYYVMNNVNLYTGPL